MDRSLALVPAVVVRRITPPDAAELEHFYEALSDQSRWYRFLAASRGLSHAQAAFFSSTDHAHREGLVAVATRPDGGERIVGHLCVEPADDGASAEIAIAVADAWQGHGVGRRLMREGVAWARAAGARELHATMSATNVAIHRLLCGLGLPVTMRRVGELTAISIQLETAEREAA